MPVNAAYRCAVGFGYCGQQMFNIFGYQQQDGNTTGDTDMNQLGKAIDTVLVPSLATLWCDSLSYGFVEIRRVTAVGAPIDGIDFELTPGFGTVEEPGVPPSVGVVIRRRTPFLGRKYRGRIFIAGLPQTYETAGRLIGTSPNSVAIAAAVAVIISGTIVSGDSGAPTFRPVLLARDALVVGGDNPGWRVTPVTTAVADPILRSQRRREVGVGI